MTKCYEGRVHVPDGKQDMESGRSKNIKIITNKWIFRLKKSQDGSISRHKAKLIAHENQQTKGIDYQEVFAPVARYDTIRTFLACCVGNARTPDGRSNSVRSAQVKG